MERYRNSEATETQDTKNSQRRVTHLTSARRLTVNLFQRKPSLEELTRIQENTQKQKRYDGMQRVLDAACSNIVLVD